MTKTNYLNLKKIVWFIIIPVLMITVVAQTEVSFQPLLLSTNRNLILSLNAPSGKVHRLQTTEDLLNWLNLVTFEASPGICRYTDTAVSLFPRRFYRAVQMAGTNYISGDHIQTDNGEVIIKPINHATFVMQWGTNTIYFDPTGAASRYAALPKSTLLFLTHAHSDHYSASTITNVITPATKIITPKIVWNQLPAYLSPYAILMTNGMTTNINGIKIEALPMYNTTSSSHQKGDGNGYILTIGNKRFYISGDTEDIPEMRALKNIDVAFIAMNKPYTMNVQQAASAILEFKPKIVYPYHYSPSNPPTDLNAFSKAVANEVEVRLRKWY